MRTLLLGLAFVAALASSVNAAEVVPEVQNFHSYTPSLATSGQPKRAQFRAIAAAGYKVVVNVAANDSNPDAVRDEKQVVEAEGMEYYYFPLMGKTGFQSSRSDRESPRQDERQSGLGSLLCQLSRLSCGLSPAHHEKWRSRGR